MCRPFLSRRQNTIAQLARPQLLTDVRDCGRLVMRMLLRVMVLRTNRVRYRVESTRRNALALKLVVQLKRLR